MKKHSSIAIAVTIAILALFTVASISMAADLMINKKIDNIVFKTDKNGVPFARIAVQDTGTLNGVTYNKSSIIMVFGDHVQSVKTLKKGATLKAIVNEREYKGDKSYTLLKLVP